MKKLVSVALINHALIDVESGMNAYWVCRYCRASEIVNNTEYRTVYNEAKDEDEFFPDPLAEQQKRIKHLDNCPVLAAQRILER